MARRRVNTTKYEIIRVATRQFLEKGYSATSPRTICDELDLSTGNLTYYFQTKEHLLAVLVEMLCDFQWKMIQAVVEEGHTSILAICLELATMIVMCDENEIAKDFYLSAYSHPHTLEIIRKNDARRAKMVFGDYCENWTDEQYAEAEILVSGIEYASMLPVGDPVSTEARIAGAIENILGIYNVPSIIREAKINKLFKMDYRKISREILKEFREYVEEVNDHTFEELFK